MEKNNLFVVCFEDLSSHDVAIVEIDCLSLKPDRVLAVGERVAKRKKKQN